MSESEQKVICPHCGGYGDKWDWARGTWIDCTLCHRSCYVTEAQIAQYLLTEPAEQIPQPVRTYKPRPKP